MLKGKRKMEAEYHTKINTATELTIKVGSLAAKKMSHNWL